MKNIFKIMTALVFLPLAGLLCWPVQALGERISPFDLDTSAGNSKIVAHGELHPDGTLRVIEVFKGKPEGPGDLRLPIDEIRFFKSVSKDIGNEDNPQVVVFLSDFEANGIYRLARGSTGSVVAFGPGDKVFAWLPSEMSRMGAAFQAHPSWTKRTFMEELKQSLKLDAELDAVLAKPRGGERLTTCFEFLRAHQPWKTSTDTWDLPWPWNGHGYFFSKIANATQKPSAAEESVLAGLLRNAGSEGDRARVLMFIGSIHSSRTLYPEVLPWVDVKVPKIPRQQAFTALASIDSFAAAEVLSHFLSLDDPLIDDVISTLNQCTWMREPRLLNPAVVEPVLALARQVLIKCHSGDNRDGNRGYATLGVLQSYFHPTWLPLIIEWANDKDTPTRAQAMSNLRSVLGIIHEPADPERIAKWWAQNRDVVMRHHDLSSWVGVNAWLQVWQQSDDKITKHVLLRLWDFTPSIPEQELLNACEDESGTAAKELLSELWQRKRLTAATRKAIVAQYMKMGIVDRPSVNSVDPNVWRERHVVGDRLFPFPHDAWVNWTGEMTTDREPKISAGSFNSNSLEGSGACEFVGGTGELGGPFKAILELWEMDYQTTPPKELWRLHWALDQDTKKPVGPILAE